jgi:hypothetical protein
MPSSQGAIVANETKFPGARAARRAAPTFCDAADVSPISLTAHVGEIRRSNEHGTRPADPARRAACAAPHHRNQAGSSRSPTGCTRVASRSASTPPPPTRPAAGTDEGGLAPACTAPCAVAVRGESRYKGRAGSDPNLKFTGLTQNLGQLYEALIGIFTQTAGSTCAFWVSPVNFISVRSSRRELGLARPRDGGRAGIRGVGCAIDAGGPSRTYSPALFYTPWHPYAAVAAWGRRRVTPPPSRRRGLGEGRQLRLRQLVGPHREPARHVRGHPGSHLHLGW